MRALFVPALALSAIAAAAIAPRLHAALPPQAPAAHVAPPPLTAATVDGGPTVQVRLDRTAALPGEIVRAEIQITAPRADGVPDPRPTDVVLVLDTSGSMQGEKMATAQRAAQELVGLLGAEDRVAVVSFSNTAEVVSPLEAGRAAARGAIERLMATASTNMAAGLVVGREALGDPLPGRARRVVLLSDGLPDDAGPLDSLASRFLANESPLSTVGIGDDYDPLLMQRLADRGTGNFYWAGPETPLATIFADEFDVARTTVAQQVTLQLAPGSGVSIAGVSGFDVRDGQVSLGAMFSGQQRSLFVDLVVHGAGPVDLGALTVGATLADGATAQSTLTLGRVELVRDAQRAVASIDGSVWEAGVVDEEYNALRREVAEALARGDQGAAVQQVADYRLRNASLNEVVQSQKVHDNLAEVEVLEKQLKSGDVDKKGYVDLATKSYQQRRKGQTKAY